MSTAYLEKHAELIEACKTGDARAQRKIYALYSRAMLNTGYRILNDLPEAEDVLQESFLEAFRNLSRFRKEGSFGSWLKRIIINKSLSRLRLHEYSVIKTDTSEAEHLSDEEPEDQAELGLKLDEVRKAVQELAEGYRVVLSLYLFEGYDHEEIAGILDITETTSRTQYLRGRGRLLQILKKKGIGNYER